MHSFPPSQALSPYDVTILLCVLESCVCVTDHQVSVVLMQVRNLAWLSSLRFLGDDGYGGEVTSFGRVCEAQTSTSLNPIPL